MRICSPTRCARPRRKSGLSSPPPASRPSRRSGSSAGGGHDEAQMAGPVRARHRAGHEEARPFPDVEKLFQQIKTALKADPKAMQRQWAAELKREIDARAAELKQ